MRSSACCALDSVGLGTVAVSMLRIIRRPLVQYVVTERHSRPLSPPLNHTCCDASRHNLPKPHKTAMMHYMCENYTNIHTTNKKR